MPAIIYGSNASRQIQCFNGFRSNAAKERLPASFKWTKQGGFGNMGSIRTLVDNCKIARL